MSPQPRGLDRVRYVPALDGIRGLILPGTVFVHYWVFFAPLPNAPGWLRDAGPFTFNIQMFFVLSGALITALLVSEHDRTGEVSLPKFYLRRSRRLGPALIAIVVLLLVANYTLRHGQIPPLGLTPWITAGSILIFMSNWRLVASHSGLGWLGPTWTLGIEEQFYLTWPFLLRAALRRGASPRSIRIGLISAVAASVAISATLLPLLGWQRTFHSTPTELPSILLGCLLGFELATNPGGRLSELLRGWQAGVVGLVGLIAISYFLWDHDPALADGGLAAYAVFASLLVGHCFVVAGEETWLSRFLGWKPFAIIGQISYEAYLVHWVVILTVLFYLPQLSIIQMIVLDSALILAVSGAFYYFVERPIRRRGWRAAIGGTLHISALSGATAKAS